MKIAVSGKGGVGKSTIAAALALLIARKGQRVLAVDADPDANLAAALGVPEELKETIVPIAKQAALIEERTGAKVEQYGQIFTLNPQVSDIAANYSLNHGGVSLLVLGAVERGGSGCACAENTLIRALVTDLILYKDDVLIMDMEAGVEHLGRATASGVDLLLVVVEPGQRAIDCARRIVRMAGEIEVKNIKILANKVDGDEDMAFIREALPEQQFLTFLPYLAEIKKADRNEQSVLSHLPPPVLENLEKVIAAL